VPGELLIDAGEDVAIGDVAALDVFVRAGDQITINTRNEGQVRLRDGTVESDNGVDLLGNTVTLVAPGGIVKSGQGTQHVMIGTPTAFTESGEMNAQLLAEVESGNFQLREIFQDGRKLQATDFFVNETPGDQLGSNEQGSRRIASSFVLDMTPAGAGRGNVGENFAGVAAATTQAPDGSTNQAAVSARPLRENELLSFLECGSDEDLDPARIQECEETAVGDMRANSQAAQDAHEAYLELFGPRIGRPARVAQAQADLAEALDSGDMDAPILATIRRLFDAVEQMGMGDEAMVSFQAAVLDVVRPSGHTLEQVYSLLEASY